MAHHNTVFAQLLKLVPRHQFETLAKTHHVGRRFRKTSRWSQFVALAMGQLSGRHSLRDVVALGPDLALVSPGGAAGEPLDPGPG